MGDEELDDIRRRKMMELQAHLEQQARAEEDAKAMEAQRQAILRSILTPEAKERLARIKMTYPEFATNVENQLIILAQTGRLGGRRITDKMLKDILRKVQPSRRDIKIKRV